MPRNETDRIKRLLTEDTVATKNSALGSFVEGYRTLPRDIPRWFVWSYFITMAIMAIIAFFLLRDWSTDSVIVTVVVFAILNVVFFFMFLGYREETGSKLRPMRFFFLYDNGFIEERRLKDNSVVESTMVLFSEVETVDFYMTRMRNNTFRSDFRVLGKKGDVLYEIISYDYKATTEIAANGIMRIWVKYKAKGLLDKIHNGETVWFENIEMGRKLLKVHDKRNGDFDCYNGPWHLDVSSAFITMIPYDAESSKYYHKTKNPSGAWRITIATLKNKLLFIELFKELYWEKIGGN